MLVIGKENSINVLIKVKEELVYFMAQLEGNTLTFAETKTVIEGQGVNKPLSDINQVININKAWDKIIEQVINNEFNLSRLNFAYINSIVSLGENHDNRGDFRLKPIRVLGTEWKGSQLTALMADFENMKTAFETNSTDDKFVDLFLTACRCQFFGDGNKRTALLMTSGALAIEGKIPFYIKNTQKTDYIESILKYYSTQDKSARDKMKEIFLSNQNELEKDFGLVTKNKDFK